MDYIDLRSRKPEKKEETVASSAGATDNPLGFLGGLADAGKEEESLVANKRDVIEILNLLHSKISNMEDKLHRIQRILEEKKYR